MTLRYGDIEFVGLLVWAVAFAVAERRWPAWPVDRRRQLRLDLLALVALVAAANVVRPGVTHAFDAVGLRDAVGPLAVLRALPAPLKILVGFVVNDFFLYWIHRAMHGPLWRTHRWHHSVEELYWFSGFRTSVLHAFLFAIPQIAVAFFVLDLSQVEAGFAFALGAFFQLTRGVAGSAPRTVADLAFGSGGELWDHAASRLSLGPLDALVISPRYHRVHHSVVREDQQSNYGIFLTVWDRAFGTYRDPATVDPAAPLGLGEEVPAGRMVLGI